MLVISEHRSRPRPAKLTTALWIYGERDGARFRLLCCACDLVKATGFPDPCAQVVAPCLHLTGGAVPFGSKVPASLTAVDHVLPLTYVTYVGLGPEVDVPQERAVELVVHSPAGRGPDRPMSEIAVRATLAELRDPVRTIPDASVSLRRVTETE